MNLSFEQLTFKTIGGERQVTGSRDIDIDSYRLYEPCRERAIGVNNLMEAIIKADESESFTNLDGELMLENGFRDIEAAHPDCGISVSIGYEPTDIDFIERHDWKDYSLYCKRKGQECSGCPLKEIVELRPISIIGNPDEDKN
jgi:hypothetical protein